MGKRFTPAILLSAAIGGLLWLMYFFYMLAPVAEGISAKEFTIQKGESFKEIVDNLYQAGDIKSASFFKLYSILTGEAHQLKPGVYSISLASTTPQIINQLVGGPSQEVTILITEGETMREIDAKLAGVGVIKAGDLLKFPVKRVAAEYPFLSGAPGLEGFLFPDTYRFYYESDPATVVRTFLDNFQSRVIPIIPARVKSYLSAITIASLIEAEVPGADDRRIVSGIIAKRLSIDMPLQVDATVSYALLNGSHYDTYKFFGLPPGPISNPGLDAIDAAVNPKKSAYLYYLSDPKTGKTIFSTTFEEHVAAQKKYFP